MQLASRFAKHSPVLRSEHSLSDDQIRTVAPSIFAQRHTAAARSATATSRRPMCCGNSEGRASSPSWCARPVCARRAGAISPST
jgi:hypothetical protein